MTVAGDLLDLDAHRHDPADEEHTELDSDAVLAQAFLRASRSRTAEVVAVNERLLMATSVAASHVNAMDQTLLWRWARSHRDKGMAILPLAPSGHMRARCLPIYCGPALAGVLIELELPRANPLRNFRMGEEFETVLPGSSPPTIELRYQLALASECGAHTLLTGEPGVGKTTIARRLLELDSDGNDTIFELDAAAADESWSARLGVALQRPHVLLTHIDALTSTMLTTTLDAVARLGARHRVVATAADLTAVPPSSSPFPIWVDVPSLSQRLEDLPAIATEVMACLRHNGKVKRLAPGVRRQLWGYCWPGNIAELAQVLHDAVQRAPTAVVDESCIRLPAREAAGLGAQRRDLVKAAELSSLIDALDRCGGNKVAAADMLGISRSTLYRKVRALGI